MTTTKGSTKRAQHTEAENVKIEPDYRALRVAADDYAPSAGAALDEIVTLLRNVVSGTAACATFRLLTGGECNRASRARAILAAVEGD